MFGNMVEELQARSGMDGYEAEQMAYKIVRAFLIDEIKCSTAVIADGDVEDMNEELDLLKSLCRVREYIEDGNFIDDDQ